MTKCELCGEPMPAGEERFKFHGYSGPCPEPKERELTPEDHALIDKAWERHKAAAPSAEQALVLLAEAHQVEVRVLHEALERALSHFLAMGGEKAARAAAEIEAVLRP